MTPTKKTIQDPDLARVDSALQRAAQIARKTAKDTRTPLVIIKTVELLCNLLKRKCPRNHGKIMFAGCWDRTKIEHRQLGHELKNKAVFRP